MQTYRRPRLQPRGDPRQRRRADNLEARRINDGKRTVVLFFKDQPKGRRVLCDSGDGNQQNNGQPCRRNYPVSSRTHPSANLLISDVTTSVSPSRAFVLCRPQIGRQKVADLIDEPRKRRAHRPWGQFVQMSKHHAPGALHADLHDEGADRQDERRRAVGPERYCRQRDQRRDGDRIDPADPLLQPAEEQPARYRADIGNDQHDAYCPMFEAVLLLEEHRVKILRAVAEQVEDHHQRDGVD